MRQLFSTTLAAALACATLGGCTMSGPPAGTGGTRADMAMAPAADAGAAATFTLSVDSAKSRVKLNGVSPQAGRYFLVLSVTIKNQSATPPLLTAGTLFSVITDKSISVPIAAAYATLPGACTDLSVAAGGMLSCPVAFEVPTGQNPVRLDYADPMLRKASAVVPAIDNAPCDVIADWGNANSSACSSCVQTLATSSCGSFSDCSVFESDCLSKQLALPTGSVCTAAKTCNVSAKCATDVSNLATCMASTCAGQCE
jgi:hypothetical protein